VRTADYLRPLEAVEFTEVLLLRLCSDFVVDLERDLPWVEESIDLCIMETYRLVFSLLLRLGLEPLVTLESQMPNLSSLLAAKSGTIVLKFLNRSILPSLDLRRLSLADELSRFLRNSRTSLFCEL
jgi:hypothetical protein